MPEDSELEDEAGSGEVYVGVTCELPADMEELLELLLLLLLL